MRMNMDIHWDSRGEYATDLFTSAAVRTILKHNESEPMFLYVSQLAPHAANYFDPLQAPADEIRKQSHIRNIDRRRYAAIVSKLDDGVGQIVQALGRRKMLDNSVILFFSDNGAPIVGEHANSGSNYPFKGVSRYILLVLYMGNIEKIFRKSVQILDQFNSFEMSYQIYQHSIKGSK